MRHSTTKSFQNSHLRYAAKLLFQFRIERNSHSNKRRLCEERIILLTARSDREAIRQAKHQGARAQYEYENTEGNRVCFEFIGVRDMIQLGAECNQDEVWYGLKEMMEPMEKRDKILPPERQLLKPQGFGYRKGQWINLLVPAQLKVGRRKKAET